MSYYARKTFDDFGKFLNENVLGPLNTTVDLIAEHFPTVGKIRDRVKGSVGNIVGSVTSAFGNVFSDIKSKSSGDSGIFGGGRAGGDMNALAQAVWEYATRTLTSGGGGTNALTLPQFLALKELKKANGKRNRVGKERKPKG
jgi:hypothetical protein